MDIYMSKTQIYQMLTFCYLSSRSLFVKNMKIKHDRYSYDPAPLPSHSHLRDNYYSDVGVYQFQLYIFWICILSFIDF